MDDCIIRKPLSSPASHVMWIGGKMLIPTLRLKIRIVQTGVDLSYWLHISMIDYNGIGRRTCWETNVYWMCNNTIWNIQNACRLHSFIHTCPHKYAEMKIYNIIIHMISLTESEHDKWNFAVISYLDITIMAVRRLYIIITYNWPPFELNYVWEMAGADPIGSLLIFIAEGFTVHPTDSATWWCPELEICSMSK